jgi:RHS repeat-associated protein
MRLRPNKFTGKERDSESGLDYFGARYYASSLGRFSSPDPARITEDMTDPQTLNRYSYAFNRPTVLVDPDGEWPGWFHHQIIENTFGNLGAHAVEVLEAASDWVDSATAGNQAPERAFMHAMSNGATDPPQSADAAERDTNRYINTELQAAVNAQVTYESTGGKGYSDDALTHFGHAEHTATDRTSPEHAGYQPWYCLICPSALHHSRAEERSARSTAAADDQARHDAYVAASQLWSQFQAQLAKERKKREEEKKKQKEKKPDKPNK